MHEVAGDGAEAGVYFSLPVGIDSSTVNVERVGAVPPHVAIVEVPSADLSREALCERTGLSVIGLVAVCADMDHVDAIVADTDDVHPAMSAHNWLFLRAEDALRLTPSC